MILTGELDIGQGYEIIKNVVTLKWLIQGFKQKKMTVVGH